jgi:hypothetical protein
MGRIALRLQLHRDLADRIPESVQTRIRTVRTRWYTWRTQLKQRTA